MSNKNVVKIVFIGDIYYDIRDVSIDQKIKNITTGADFVIANLEAPLTNIGYLKNGKKLQLRNSPHGIEVLKNLSVNIVNLANNHICDRGLVGLTDTFRILNENKINYIGAGYNIHDAKKPYLLNYNGLKIAFLNYTFGSIGSIGAGIHNYGTSIFNNSEDIKFISNLKNEGYRVIVIMHWDMTRYEYPLPSTLKLGKSIIDAGASLIIGHHPHVIQGYIQYENKTIVNSIGNYVFSNTSDGGVAFILSDEERHGLLAEVELTNQIHENITFYHTVYKIENNNIIVKLDENRERLNVFNKLSQALYLKYYNIYYKVYAIKRLLKRFPVLFHHSNIKNIRYAHLLGMFKSIKNIFISNK